MIAFQGEMVLMTKVTNEVWNFMIEKVLKMKKKHTILAI